ncbi:MAG TPA: GNAT family N-acetyltransferase [Nitrososphaeraceae archaeon]
MTKEMASHKSFPKLNGLLVILRELSMSDAEDISNLMSYNISKSLWQIPYPYTVENASNFINSSHIDFESQIAVNFAIEYKNNPEGESPLVGIISLKNIDLNKKKAIGYWIGELYWGKGIATESVALVITYAFSMFGLEEICAYVFSENKASIRVIEKNGMIKKEELNEFNKMSGRYHRTTKYVLQRSYNLGKL